MKNNCQKFIEVLNNLIEINNDRMEGYERATKDAKEADLKNLFSQLSETSRNGRKELSAEVKKMGGIPKEGTSVSGKVYRAWKDVKVSLTKKDRKAILNSCECGEDIAVKAYKNIIDNNSVAGHSNLLKKQYDLIKRDYDKVRSLRNELVNAQSI